MLKGLIFDFDGLILDTETPIFRAWQKVYGSYGCSLPVDTWISTIGSSELYFDPVQYLHSISHFKVNDVDVLRFYSQYEAEFIAQEKIMPGILDLIVNASKTGYKLAIASSSPISWVVKYARELGIENYFNIYATKDEVKLTKPHPDLYLLALEKLNLNHSEVVALEDSVHGILAAAEAGIFTIAIPANMTRNLDFSNADMIVECASEINLNNVNDRLFQKWQSN